MKPPEDRLFAEEDDLPNTPVPPLNPPPSEFSELPHLPRAPTTEPAPPLTLAEILEAIHAVETRIADRQVQAYNDLQDEFRRRLDLQSKNAADNLDAAVKLVLGAVDGVHDEVKDLKKFIGAALERLDDNLKDEFGKKLTLVAERTVGLQHVIDAATVTKDTAKKALDTALAARREQGHEVDEFDRPTLAEVKPPR